MLRRLSHFVCVHFLIFLQKVDVQLWLWNESEQRLLEGILSSHHLSLAYIGAPCANTRQSWILSVQRWIWVIDVKGPEHVGVISTHRVTETMWSNCCTNCVYTIFNGSHYWPLWKELRTKALVTVIQHSALVVIVYLWLHLNGLGFITAYQYQLLCILYKLFHFANLVYTERLTDM